MNVFEGVTKEMFIEMYNRRNNDKLFLIGSYLMFELSVKSDSFFGRKNYNDKIKIKNIHNYESEIEVFNSFDVFREYNGEPILIWKNINKYFKHRKMLNNITYHNNSYSITQCQNITLFNTYVKSDRIKKKLIEANKEIAKKLIEEQINPFIKSIEDIIKSKLSFLDSQYNTEHTYEVRVKEFNRVNNELKLTEKHLTDNNFLNSFELNIHSTKNTFNDETKLENYVLFKNKFYDAILETAAYLKYEVYGVNEYYFKKIKD
jgi:hypothetical protein